MKQESPFIRIFVTFVLAIFVTGALQAQTTVQIGTETTAGNYLINTLRHKTYTQTIYTEDLLPPAMEITEISYEYVGTENRAKRIKVWFSVTDEDNIQGKYVSSETNKQVVFEGVITRTPPTGGTESTWATLVLDQPYVYIGGNLVITTSVCDVPHDPSSNSDFRVSPSATGKHVTTLYIESWEPTNQFLENITGFSTMVSASYTNFLNIKLTYQTIEGAIVSLKPGALNFPEQLINTTETQSVTVFNVGTAPFTVSGVNISNNVFSCTATFPMVINAGASQQVNFGFTSDIQRAYSGTAEFVIEGDYYGNNILELKGKAIDFIPQDTNCWEPLGTAGGSTGIHGPMTDYKYSAQQYIMTKDDIGTDVMGRIRRIGWQSNGPTVGNNVIAVYLKNTTQENFPRTGIVWTNAAEMTKVYEGPYMFTEAGWNYVELDEPFLYDGTSNIMVTSVQVEASVAKLSQFYVSQKGPSMAATFQSYLLIWSGGQPVDVYNPPVFPTTGSGNVYNTRNDNNAPNTCFVFDEIPQDPYLIIDKQALDYLDQEKNTITTLPVTVKNFGQDDMIITGVNFTSEDFYVTDITFPVTIPLGEERIFNFAVTPLSLGLIIEQATFEFAASVLGNYPHVDLRVFGLHFNALKEDLEKEMFPPIGWKIIDNNDNGKTWNRYVGTAWITESMYRPVASCEYYVPTESFTEPVQDDWFITPKMKYATGDKFSFWLAGHSFQWERNRLYVKLSRTGTNIGDFTQTLDFIQPDNTNYMKYEYDMGELGLKDGDEFYIGFHDISHSNNRFAQISEFRGPIKVVFEQDLLVQEFQTNATLDGNATVFCVNTTKNFSAFVANAGLNNVGENDYTVELCRYDNNNNVIVLASMPGQNLTREGYCKVSFDYAFTEVGKF